MTDKTNVIKRFIELVNSNGIEIRPLSNYIIGVDLANGESQSVRHTYRSTDRGGENGENKLFELWKASS